VAIFAAGPIVRQPQEVLHGYLAILSCGRDPVEPVAWTFQNSSVEDGSRSKRYRIRGSSLHIHDVEVSDSGSYNCTDATGELHHADCLG